MMQARKIDPIENLVRQMESKAEAITKARERLDKGEERLSMQVLQIAKLVQRYNQDRLDGLVDVLASKGLAFYEEGHEYKLVREKELVFVTERGVRGEYFGEYDSYYREVPYVHTHLKRVKETHRIYGRSDTYKNAHNGVTVRQKWVESFKNHFATTRNRDLPGWLLVAIDDSDSPPEPISCNSSLSSKQKAHATVTVLGKVHLVVACWEPSHFYKHTSYIA